jgi:acyl dehydratase
MSNSLPAVGQTASRSFVADEATVRAFSALSHDHNPVHVDDEYAARSRFGQRIAHGMLMGIFISAVLGNDLPGPGAIYLGQTLTFRAPVYIADAVTVMVEVTAVRADKRIVTLRTDVTKADGTLAVTGEATLMLLEE